MPEVIGIDHLYISVSSIERSQAFYDKVFVDVLGFRKNSFVLAGDAHVQYYNRHFGYVLRPARVVQAHEPYAPGAAPCVPARRVDRRRPRRVARAAQRRDRG
jgi:catechol 2,3-dioxygenase-like lactoylglutathione lyase family enzyme